MTFFIVVSILHLIPLNALVSHRVLRDPLMTPAQKGWQVAIVWLVPFLGALLVWFLRKQAHAAQPPETSEWRNPPFEPEDDIPHE
jgi:hypothetical protein